MCFLRVGLQVPEVARPTCRPAAYTGTCARHVTGETVTVTYSDNVGVALASIDKGDISVAGHHASVSAHTGLDVEEAGPGCASATAEALFLFDRSLGGRDGLEPRVGDRLAALNRPSIGSGRQSGLGEKGAERPYNESAGLLGFLECNAHVGFVVPNTVEGARIGGAKVLELTLDGFSRRQFAVRFEDGALAVDSVGLDAVSATGSWSARHTPRCERRRRV